MYRDLQLRNYESEPEIPRLAHIFLDGRGAEASLRARSSCPTAAKMVFFRRNLCVASFRFRVLLFVGPDYKAWYEILELF